MRGAFHPPRLRSARGVYNPAADDTGNFSTETVPLVYFFLHPPSVLERTNIIVASLGLLLVESPPPTQDKTRLYTSSCLPSPRPTPPPPPPLPLSMYVVYPLSTSSHPHAKTIAVLLSASHQPGKQKYVVRCPLTTLLVRSKNCIFAFLSKILYKK